LVGLVADPPANAMDAAPAASADAAMTTPAPLRANWAALQDTPLLGGGPVDPRPRWADLEDSSQEQDSQGIRAPTSQGSYRCMSQSQDSPEDNRSSTLCEGLSRTALARVREESPVSLRCALAGVREEAAAAPAAQPLVATGASPSTQAATKMVGVIAASEASPSTQAANKMVGVIAASEVPLSERLRSWKPEQAPVQVVAAPRATTTTAPPSTPLRRRTRTRNEAPGAQTPGGKRLRSGSAVEDAAAAAAAADAAAEEEAAAVVNVPAPIPEATPEEWERRNRKRTASVAAIKAMPEYDQVVQLRARGEMKQEDLPLTPDPDDETTSKRSWETSVMQWRSALRRLPL